MDFPCNQFLNQASGSAEEINQTCSVTYGTTFPRCAKIEVNGVGASPLYRYLKKEKSTLLGEEVESSGILPSFWSIDRGAWSNPISINYTSKAQSIFSLSKFVNLPKAFW